MLPLFINLLRKCVVVGQREPDFAEQLALSAYVENRVGEKLDYIAPVEEELVLRLRRTVIVEGERLGV